MHAPSGLCVPEPSFTTCLGHHPFLHGWGPLPRHLSWFGKSGVPWHTHFGTFSGCSLELVVSLHGH
eukprot:12883795-Prorocentrum_lima.AAC.1